MRKIIKQLVLVIGVCIYVGVGVNQIIAAETECSPGSSECCTTSLGRPGRRTCSSTGFWLTCSTCTGCNAYCSLGQCRTNVQCSGTSDFCYNNDVYRCISSCTREFVRDCGSNGCNGGECLADQCSSGQIKCEASYEYACNTAADPNAWYQDDYCTFGCNAAGTACATAPSLPYCVSQWQCRIAAPDNMCLGPSGDLACGPADSCIYCWNSYAEYDNDAPPTSNTCVNTGSCVGSGCVPTQIWCEGQKAPCPPDFPPYTSSDTYYWGSNCSFDCGGSVYNGNVCQDLPEPTPPPVGGQTPNCTVSLTGPNSLVRGGAAQTYTATVNVGFGVVERVVFSSLDQDLIPAASQTDDLLPYEANYSAVEEPADNSAVITATVYMGGLSICEASTTISFERPTTTVAVNVREVPIDSCDPGANIGNVGVSMNSTNPGGFNYSGNTSVANPIVWNPVQAGAVYRMDLSGNGLNNYVYQACGQGSNPRLNFNIPYINLPAAGYVANFYFTRQAQAWFQIYHGDVGAAGGSISSLVSGDNNTFLAQLVANSSGVAMANGAVAANPVGPAGRLWQADGVNFSQVDYWYGYFMASFDQVFTQQDIEELSQDSFDDDIWDTHSEEVDSRVLWVSGDLAVNHDIDVPPGKWTIFVPGNLEIDAPGIVTEQGEYIAFVVRGNINFTDRTRQIQGVYVADGELTVENTTMDFGTGRQFEGQGIFIGQGGVTLQRDLNGSTLPDDDLANNTAAAQVFTYRPDFVINAPRGFLRSGMTWQEVAPGAVAPTEVLPETIPPEQICVQAGGVCDSHDDCCSGRCRNTTGLCAPLD